MTRSVTDDLHRWLLSKDGTVVQTNIDHYMDENDDDAFDVMVHLTFEIVDDCEIEYRLHSNPTSVVS